MGLEVARRHQKPYCKQHHDDMSGTEVMISTSIGAEQTNVFGNTVDMISEMTQQCTIATRIYNKL
jgi:hypothetical protein